MSDTAFDFDETLGGTFAMDVPLDERLAAEEDD